MRWTKSRGRLSWAPEKTQTSIFRNPSYETFRSYNAKTREAGHNEFGADFDIEIDRDQVMVGAANLPAIHNPPRHQYRIHKLTQPHYASKKNEKTGGTDGFGVPSRGELHSSHAPKTAPSIGPLNPIVLRKRVLSIGESYNIGQTNIVVVTFS